MPILSSVTVLIRLHWPFLYPRTQQYGFAIHGHITGYVIVVVIVLIMLITLYRLSRKTIWLEVLTTYNDPNVALTGYTAK